MTTTERRHPAEDDLILHYYGEADGRWVGDHLAGCEDCRGEMDRLRRTLDLAEVPAPDGPDDLAIARIRRGVERAIAAGGAPRVAAGRRAWWAAAAAAAVLAVAAFLAGRMTGPAGEPVAQEVRERARLLAVADHLERSRRAVTELVNTPEAPDAADGEVDDAYRRLRATELAAFNRLHRQFAAGAGDRVTEALLEDLERILLDVANAESIDAKGVLELQRRVARTDLLYRMRLSEDAARERASPPPPTRGADEA